MEYHFDVLSVCQKARQVWTSETIRPASVNLDLTLTSDPCHIFTENHLAGQTDFVFITSRLLFLHSVANFLALQQILKSPEFNVQM